MNDKDEKISSNGLSSLLRDAITENQDLATPIIESSSNTSKGQKEKHHVPLEEKLIKEDAPISKIESYLNNKYEFRLNVVTGYPEYRPIGESKYERVTDNILNTLWRELLKTRRQCAPNFLINLLNSDFAVPYDPFTEYLEGLPEWDGETDYIKQLAETVNTNNPDFFLFCLRKWFVAMVGCWSVASVVNQSAIVFSGSQGIGKTTWIDNLMPLELKYYYFSGTIDPNNKDTSIHLSECGLINMDELENLNRSDIGTLKEIITKGQIKLRRAYAKSSEVLPRRASFAGSVNSNQFLNDPTGSRRFLCFEAYEFNLDHTVDMHNVYSQSIALFKSGFRYWFDKEEIKLLSKNNEQYQKIPLEEELLLQLYEPCESGSEACEYLTATEISFTFGNVFKIRTDNALVNRIGKAATRHDFKKVKKHGVYKYCLKRRETDLTNEVLEETEREGEVT